MRFPSNGKWWINRTTTRIDDEGTVTIELWVDDRCSGDIVVLTGKPDTLRKIAWAIVAHVESAEANTEAAS